MSGKPTYEELEQRIQELEKAESERQQVEEERRESEANYEEVLSMISDIVWRYEIDGQGQFITSYISQAADRLLGLPTGIIGNSFETYFSYLHPEDLPGVLEIFSSGLANTAKETFAEYRLCRPDGKICWVRSYGSAYLLSDGHIVAFGTTTDITERKQMEEALRESEKKYQSLYHNAPVALFRTSVDGKLIEINKQYAEMAGYSNVADCMAEFEPGKAWVDTNGRNELVKVLQKNGSVSNYETKIIRRDGTHIWILFSATIYPEQGFIEGSIIEITDRKLAEAALKRSESMQRKMFANIGDVIVIVDQDGINRYKSPNSERLFGWKPEDVIGASTWENVHPDDLESTQKFFGTLMHEPNAVGTVECRYRCKDTSYRWIELTGSNLLHDPDIRGVLGNYHEITERKQAEQLLRESETRFKALHNASFGGIAIHDKGVIMDCNQGLSQITGYSVTELIGMDGLLLIAEKSRNAVMNNIVSGYEKPYEAFGLRKNGEEFPVRLEARNIPYKGKNVRTVEFRDITENKRAEEEREKLQAQLLQAQKMESVGRLAGGVAHDFNNMLNVIIGNTELAMDNVVLDDPLHHALQEILNAAHRSADITRQLLAFARKQTIAPKVLDLNETVGGMLNMIRRLIGENIDLAWFPGANVWPVRMDPSQIDQILANLCVNARDAITDVGKITIETGKATFDEAYCTDHVGFVPGEYVLLAVSDDGSGMAPETLANLFEPFFTTKDVNKGTGLGLATVYGIAKQNNGFINVYSEPEKGTSFRIYLPRHETEKKQIHKKDLMTPDARGKETILLVEDEPAILRMTAIMLERLGYSVLEASTPGEAIRLAREYSGEIHLLMTDVVMPEMNGRDLAGNLLSLYPNLKCLFMSGYTADVIAHHGVLDEGVNFIQKPFARQDLAFKVREVLDETN